VTRNVCGQRRPATAACILACACRRPLIVGYRVQFRTTDRDPALPARPQHIVFVFWDGVGLGTRAANPFRTAEMPFLDTLLEGQRPLAASPVAVARQAGAYGVDACLGVAGRPQSATGQAALVSGRNVPRLLGEHYGPKPNAAVRALLDQENLFAELVAAGLRVASANAYPPAYFAGIDSGRRLLSVIPYALRQAGLSLGSLETYRQGQAIAGTLTGRDWRERLGLADVPVYTPEAAGAVVGRRSQEVDFLFYEHWVTDLLGHRHQFAEAVAHFTDLDRFLRGLTEGVDLDRTLILVGSDHGNVEDCSHGRHTRHPALGMAWGAGFERAMARVHDLTCYRPLIAELLLPRHRA